MRNEMVVLCLHGLDYLHGLILLRMLAREFGVEMKNEGM